MLHISILFIDDSDLDVMLAVRVLRASGYEVRYERIQDAAEFAERLGKGWDVVICDHRMPAFDAVSALRMYRERGEDVPFLIVSGAMPDDLAIAAMREGARDFIHKDNLSRLVPAIEREMREARNRVLLRQTQASVDHLLHADLLTGLGNADALMLQLQAAIGQGRPFALYLVDLNRFRRVTQRMGGVVANRILRVAALRLEGLMQGRGFAARIGMDRFALICPDIDNAFKVTGFGKDIHQCLQDPVELDEQRFVMTAGVGAALYPVHAAPPDRLLRAAESALAHAKRAGHRQVALYAPEMEVREQDAKVTERALRRAVFAQEFVLHYQPQMDLGSGRPVGVEALIRWNCPERGLMGPGDFVAALEDCGLILPVGDWVIGEAARQLSVWRATGLAVPRMGINLSLPQFQQADLVARLDEQFGRAGVLAQDFELEITERMAMGSEESAIATLNALKARGVRLAIDDFGTGYSSMAYLQHFPVDCLKIDRSFIGRDSEDDGLGMAGAVIAMAQGLRLETLAEGVETLGQAQRLAASGCHSAQGYHFARPMPADACAAFLRQWQ